MSRKKARNAGRRKPGTGARLALAVVTCVNLLLTLALSVQRRKDVLRAVSSDDGTVRLLLEKAEQQGGKAGQ